MSKSTIPLREIQLAQLNNECLKLVVKFVRVLKAHKGVSLRMQDADILLQISARSHRTRNASHICRVEGRNSKIGSAVDG